MVVTLKFQGETIRIDLNEELSISEARINKELHDQPTHFAFLSMLLVKMKKELTKSQVDLDKIRGELFIEYKRSIDPETGRTYSNDLAEANVLLEEDYIRAQEIVIEREEQFGIVKAAVDAFNQRKDLIQSLSANLRKEL